MWCTLQRTDRKHKTGKIFLGFSTWFAFPTLSSQSPNVSLAPHPYLKARNTPFHPGNTFFLPSLNPPSKDAPSPRNFPHGIFMLWNDRSYSEKVRLQLFISDLLIQCPQGDILMGNTDRACSIPYATSLSCLHIFYHRLWCLLQGQWASSETFKEFHFEANLLDFLEDTEELLVGP